MKNEFTSHDEAIEYLKSIGEITTYHGRIEQDNLMYLYTFIHKGKSYLVGVHETGKIKQYGAAPRL